MKKTMDYKYVNISCLGYSGPKTISNHANVVLLPVSQIQRIKEIERILTCNTKPNWFENDTERK